MRKRSDNARVQCENLSEIRKIRSLLRTCVCFTVLKRLFLLRSGASETLKISHVIKECEKSKIYTNRMEIKQKWHCFFFFFFCSLKLFPACSKTIFWDCHFFALSYRYVATTWKRSLKCKYYYCYYYYFIIIIIIIILLLYYYSLSISHTELRILR
jgi:hypothetical protein